MILLAYISHWDWSWEAVTALATIVLTAATAVLAYGVPKELKRARRDERYLFYAQLDRTYFEIQKLLMQKPYLSNRPDLKRTKAEEHEYDAFAFIVWNFLESIFDYSEKDDFLLETWGCIFKYEARRHLEWFRRDENHEKFKERFRKYVCREISI
jgi:hypothetical protein